ncbi:Pkig [Columba livia]|nr:Pkig [Columba livia]
MAKKEPEQPHAPKCHSCPAQINRTHSDRQALCSHCKDRLGAEENSKEGSRKQLLQATLQLLKNARNSKGEANALLCNGVAEQGLVRQLGWILPAYLPSAGTVGHPKHILQTYRDAMEVESSTYTDFISSDRAGRRNAVYDIQQEATTISMRKLTGDIGNLSVEGPGELLHTPVSPVPGAGRARHEMAAQPTGASLGASQVLRRNVPFLAAVSAFVLGGCSASGRLPGLRGFCNK